jgi:hypothetical protein
MTFFCSNLLHLFHTSDCIPKEDLCRLKNGTIVCAEGWEVSCAEGACVPKGQGKGNQKIKGKKSWKSEEEGNVKRNSKGKKDDTKDMAKNKEQNSISEKTGHDYSDTSFAKGRLYKFYFIPDRVNEFASLMVTLNLTIWKVKLTKGQISVC